MRRGIFTILIVLISSSLVAAKAETCYQQVCFTSGTDLVGDAFHDFKCYIATNADNGVPLSAEWYPSNDQPQPAGVTTYSRRHFQRIDHVTLLFGSDNHLSIGILTKPGTMPSPQSYCIALRTEWQVIKLDPVKPGLCGTPSKPAVFTVGKGKTCTEVLHTSYPH
jgi:hypothetical protein